MIKQFNFKLLFIVFLLFGLTSSCEDKKSNDYGSISIQFNYKKETVTSENKTKTTLSDNKPIAFPVKDNLFDNNTKIEKEGVLYNDIPPVLSMDSPNLEEEDSVEDSRESENESSGVSAARIIIGNNVPVTINLNVQTSYSRTDLPIGSTVITVELLDDISNNTTLYQQSKSIDIIKNVDTSVIFNDFTPVNQIITMDSNSLQSEYVIGNTIDLTWTNTHSELPVAIRLIQENESTVIKTLQSNYIGNTFSWNTGAESPADNLGFMVASDDDNSSSSYSICCFDLVPDNNAPTVNDISISADKDETIDIDLDGSDSDGDELTYSIVTAPSNGSLGAISGETVSYTPNGSFNGTDTFTYKANDGNADSNIATVTVGVYWAEITNPISSSVWSADGSSEYDITWSGGFPNTGIELWNNDSKLIDIDGNVGSVNTFTYTPTGLSAGVNYQVRVYNATSSNKDDFSDYFTVTDGSTPLVVLPAGGSDFDPFQDVSILWSNFSFNARIELWKDNQYYKLIAPANMSGQGWGGTYTWASSRLPSGNQYQIRLLDIANSNTLFSDYFTINNVAPTVEDVSLFYYQTSTNSSGQIELSGDDYNYDYLTYNIVTAPSVGTVSIDENILTYNSPQGLNDSVQILYNASDGDLNSNVATATFTVQSNNPPTVNDINVSTPENTAIEINITGSDEDGDNLSYQVITYEGPGGLSDPTNNGGVGLITYTPANNWNGTDEFTYFADDNSGAGNADSEHGTVTITVTPINNNVPTAEDINTSTDEDIAKEITLLGNDGDNDNLTYSFVSNPTNGSVSLNGGVATYNPDANWSGTDTFTYKVNDGKTDSNIANVTIVVNSINDAPTVEVFNTTTWEDSPVIVSINQGDVDGDTAIASIVTQPLNGTLSGLISGTNTDFSYTPNTNWNGTDTFTYKSTDPSGDSSEITTGTIVVNPVNDLPIPNNVSVSTNFNTSTVIVLSATDIEGLGSGFNYQLVTTPSHASTWSGDNNSTNKTMDLTYVPATDWSGVDTFTFKVNDGTDNSETNGTITVTTLSSNVPVANNITGSTNEDTAKTITLDATDSENETLTYSIISTPSNGSLSNLSGNTVTYTPNTNWNGTDIFTYQANDGYSNSNTATVTVTVAAVNDVPVSNDVSININEDTATNISLSANDVESSTLTYSVVSSPSNGSLSNLSGTTVTYTPNTNWNGTDTFTYKANDGTDDSNTSTVTVVVGNIDDVPEANNVTDSTNEDTAKAITLDATDPDNDTLTYSIIGNPSNGSLGSVSGATITYTPTANWSGTDIFTYQANDGTSNSNTATVTMTVAAVNDVPVSNDISRSTNKNTAIAVEFSANDVESSTLTYSIVSSPSNGSLGSVSGATVTYTPSTDWTGTDTFTYKANDGTDDSNTSTVTITVIDIVANNAPVANNVSENTNEDIAKTITLDATDSDNDTLTYSIVSTPSNGSLSSVNGVTVTYTPTANWNGTDTFVYQASDGDSNSNTATVTVTVVAVNDPHIVSDINKTINEDTPTDFVFSSNDIDGGTPQVWSIVSQASNGTAEITDNPNGIVTYTPNTNWNGTDTFTYKINDGDDSNIGTATIIVEPVNDAPVIANMSESANEDNDATWGFGKLVDTSIDVDGDDLTYSIVSNGSNGTASVSFINSDFVYPGRYTPNENWNGVDTFTFKANDGTVDSNIATFTVTINPVNDAPTVSDFGDSTTENNDASWGFSGNDIEGDDLTYSVVTPPSNGSVSIDNVGSGGSGPTGTYTPNTNWSGTDTFTYKANDGELDSNIATATITVNAPDPLAKAIWVFPGEAPSDEPLTEGQTYKLEWAYQTGAQFSGPMLSLEQDMNFSNAGGGDEDWQVVIAPFDVNTEGETTEYNWTVPYDIGFEQYYLPNETHGRYRLRLTDAFTQVEESTTFQFVFVNSQTNPVTTDFNTSTSMNESVSENLNNLSSDAEGDNLTFSIVSQPSNGSVSIDTDDVLTYTPATNWSGTDTFTYQANDGELDSNISTITVMVGNSITVNADIYANTRDDYIAYLPIDYTSVFDINENVPGGVENHTGTSGTPKGQVSFVKCENGTINSDANNVSCDNDGKYYIRYKGTQSGYDSFSFYVRDINGAKSNMMTAYTYNGYYSSPHSIGFELTGNPPQVDSNLKILTFNDDISLKVRDGAVVDELQIRYYGPQNGDDHAWIGTKVIDTNIDGNHPNVTSYNPNGLYYQFTLTEELLQEGQPSNTNKYSFGSVYSYGPVYTNNGQGPSSGTGGAVSSVKFISNHRPVANDVAVTTPANARIDFDLSASDEDNDALYYDTVDGPSNGNLSWNNNVNGSIAYIPNHGFHGTDTFTYSAVDTPQPGAINDPWTESNIATVTVTVLNSSTIYMHAEDSHGVGTLEDPMSIFDTMQQSLLKDPDTGYATVILLPGTYTSNYDASAGPNATLETIQINLTTIGVHLKSHSGDPTDTIIERGNHNWQFGSADGGHGDGSGKLKVEGITFRGNRQSRMPFGAQGGGIIIDNCIFSDIENDTSSGPAPFIADATGPVVISNSTFEDMKLKNNRDLGEWYYGGLAYGTTITINNSTFTNISSIGNLMLSVGNFTNKEAININNSHFLMDYDDVGVGLAHTATVTHSVFRNFSTGSYGLVNKGEFTNSIIDKSFLGSAYGQGGVIKNSIIIDTDLRAVQGTYTWSGGYNLISNLGTSSSDGNYSFSFGASVSSVSEMLFEDYDNYDFHLQVGSPAIDIGDPNDDYSNEPEPNGDRINAGIYGNTVEAQISNLPPISNDEGIATSEDVAIRTGFSSSDPENDEITLYEIVSQPSNGTASIDMDATDVSGNSAPGLYVPNSNFNGTDSFTYRARDQYAWGNIATATVTVSAVNDPPVTTDIFLSVDEDSNRSIDFSDYTTNIENNDITYSVASSTNSIVSTLSQISGSSLVYTPNPNYSGQDIANHHQNTVTGSFTYKANNGDDSNISVVHMTINNTENDYSLTYPSEDPPAGEGTWPGQRFIFINQGREIYNKGLGDPGESLTISMWVKPSEDPKRSVLIANEQFNNNGWFGRVGFGGSPSGSNDGFWEFYHKPIDDSNNDHNQVISTVLPAINVWSHVAFVVDGSGGTVKLYVNGSEILSSNYDTSLDFSDNNNNFWTIGSLTFDSYHNFPGKIDEVALWKEALSSDQIGNLVSGSSASEINSNNLLLYYTFDTTTNHDDTGNHNHFNYNNVGNIQHFTNDTPYD